MSSYEQYLFDGKLILRDSVSGRIWLLGDHDGTVCRHLSGKVIDDLLLLHGDRRDRTRDDASALNRLYLGEEKGRSPFFECRVHDGDAAIHVRVWNSDLAIALRPMLAPLIGHREAACVLDLFTDHNRTFTACDGEIVHTGTGIGWWPLVRTIALKLRAGHSWLGVLHASTVVLDDAGAVIIAGASGAGKTTLAGALVARGGRLLADDATPLDAESMLAWPCPCAMGVKQGSWPIFDCLFPTFGDVAPVTIGRRRIRYFPSPRVVSNEGALISALIFPFWKPGASLAYERLRPAEALRLLAESGAMPVDDGGSLGKLLEWLGAVPAWRLCYGDLDQAVPVVRSLARRRA